MTTRRRRKLLASHRRHVQQAKSLRRLRRVGARGTAVVAATTLGLSLGAVVAPAAAVEGSPSLVADIDAGAAPGVPRFLTTMGNATYFAAFDANHRYGLWRTDGTPSGATLLKRFAGTRANDTGPRDLTVVDGTLFFTAATSESGRELWKSDGTAAGTVQVADIKPGQFSSGPAELTAYDGRVFFTASAADGAPDLWASDGTRSGTVLVKAFPDSGRFGSYQPYHLTVSGDTLFFVGSDPDHRKELWTSDGTTAGTVLVKDIEQDEYGYYGDSAPRDLADVNGTLYFSARTPGVGWEPWRSDGTPTGTVMVKDLDPVALYWPGQFTGFGGEVFFGVVTEAAGQLWKTDGTAAGTVMVKEIPAPELYDASLGDLIVAGDALYFTASDGTNGRELWRSDGTEGGTSLVADLNPGATDSSPANLTAVGATVYFTATRPDQGRELWVSDGTPSGTEPVADILAGATGSDPEWLTPLGGTLLFSAREPMHGRELWQFTPGLIGVPPPPSNQFTVATKAHRHPKRGFITVRVNVPFAGVLRQAPAAGSPVRRASMTLSGGGPVTVKVQLTKKALKRLKRRGKMKVRVAFTYTPSGGTARTKITSYRFRYTG